MAEYAILVAPSSNRVYSGSAVDLTCAELAWFAATVLDARVGDIAPVEIGRVAHVGFSGEELTERDVARLSNLSSAFTLYERRGEDLRPLPVTPRRRYPDDLVTIQRYPGKTNENFTKLLVNLAVLAGPRPDALREGKVALFDPLCGRGTTLNHALLYGFDATGVDLDRGDVDAYTAFLTTWLRDHRYKHRAAGHALRREKETLGRRFDVSVGVDKAAWKSREVDRLTVVQADTLRTRAIFARASFDVIATDAPYGVQHGSRANAALSRRPDELLEEALPVWREVLRPAGSLALSWNTHSLEREPMTALLERHGFAPVDQGVSFAHRVDRSILRDVVVARRDG